MALNQYYSQGSDAHQQMFEDIVIESIQAYGQDIVYIPRTIIEVDTILNEEVLSKFESGFTIEMYLESFDGFEGEGKLLERFGLEIRDECEFAVSKRRWKTVAAEQQYLAGEYEPMPGDLIYLPLTKSLFELRYVDTKKPFMQLKNVPTYRLTCELFRYESQELDTGIEAVDSIQDRASNVNEFDVTNPSAIFEDNETLLFTTPDGITGSLEFFELEVDEVAVPNTATLIGGILTFDSTILGEIPNGTTLTGMSTAASTSVIKHLGLGDGDNNIFANDLVADNSALSQEIADNDFIDFDEKNPFGEIFKF